jgi:hypothetical protein
MLWTITWIVVVVFGLVGLAVAFVINARALMRDLNKRRDAFRVGIEGEANAMVDHLFRATSTEPTQAPPEV